MTVLVQAHVLTRYINFLLTVPHVLGRIWVIINEMLVCVYISDCKLTFKDFSYIL